jgi:hypothetical protein
MWFAAGAIGILYYGMVKAIDVAAVRPLYEIFAGSVVTICGMVIVGNIAAKWTSAKATTPATTPPSPKAGAAVQAKIAIPESSPDPEESPH